ncbi:hypothetical protein Glove_13g255 [Diversispora epigaea]|uniref:Protein kinase domain-containing protein n=1 Tax=Diversispora epigaea TaxID=1348612 RepID=A0A397JPJ3_9GLOM|nr:hypothetical protein Glove_13g255 [Diversispora epigaea]
MEELIEKLIWKYGKCPYIFGYYVRAITVTYCYLYLEEEVLRKDLLTCDLNELVGRIQAFIIESILVDYSPTSPNASKLFSAGICYPSWQAIYGAMSNNKVLFIDQLVQVHVSEDEILPFVIFSSKGVICKSQSKAQLTKASCCVLITLEALHKIKIIHRDIRWKNVLKYIDQDKWLIIDFGDACYTTSVTSSGDILS